MLKKTLNNRLDPYFATLSMKMRHEIKKKDEKKKTPTKLRDGATGLHSIELFVWACD